MISINALIMRYHCGMVKVTRSIAIDPDILKAVERYAAVLKESTNTVIQRGVRELLERAGAWPPKPKEGK